MVGWLTLPYNHPNTGANLESANQQITRNAILAADPYVNFATFDTNGNGYISFDELHVMVVVAGYEAAYGNTCSPSVWAHEWYLDATAPIVDGKRVASSYGNGWYSGHQTPPGSEHIALPVDPSELNMSPHNYVGAALCTKTGYSIAWRLQSTAFWGRGLRLLDAGQCSVQPLPF